MEIGISLNENDASKYFMGKNVGLEKNLSFLLMEVAARRMGRRILEHIVLLMLLIPSSFHSSAAITCLEQGEEALSLELMGDEGSARDVPCHKGLDENQAGRRAWENYR